MTAKYQVDYIWEGGFVLIKVRGDFDADMLSRLTSKMVEEASKHNCSKYLLDHREARPHLSAAELYFRPQKAMSLGLERHSQTAIVYSTNDEDYKFMETVANNQGFNVRIFEYMDNAIDWLKSG